MKDPKPLTKIHAWRLEQGWTLAEMSGVTGLSESMMSRLERGERRCAPATKVEVARRLAANVAELFDVEEADATR